KACVLPENPASYRVVRTKSYLFNKADYHLKPGLYRPKVHLILLRLLLAFSPHFVHFLNEKRVSNTVKS
ncbi:hypothetical protein FKK05_26625, partial [Klebsiella pneumoniae]|nr:hypothetical protein [Klebsiella pneumoniae]MBK3174107.1 hypothetical protein [Klebsiella pneumoniae]MBK3195495.1 hypothetical protein [Klebsiella pneumoniae]MBK3205963.1 hypothetical protein [Klebsiella pneumoniae]